MAKYRQYATVVHGILTIVSVSRTDLDQNMKRKCYLLLSVKSRVREYRECVAAICVATVIEPAGDHGLKRIRIWV